MAQNTKSVKEWLSEVFGTGVPKSVSESVSAEEYNAFEAGGAKIQEQLAALELTNEGLKTSNGELTTKLTTEEAKSKQLTEQLSAITTERDKYKAVYDEKAANGISLPEHDAELQSVIAGLPAGHPDRVAMEAWAANRKK